MKIKKVNLKINLKVFSTLVAILVIFVAVNNIFTTEVNATTTAELQAQLDAYKAQLNNIKAQKAQLSTDIKNSQSQMQTDQVKIKILQDQIGTKELDIQEFEMQIAESESNLQILQNQQTQLQTDLDKTNSQIEKISSLAEYQIVEAYKKLKSVESSGLMSLLSNQSLVSSSDVDIIISKKDKLLIEQLSTLKFSQDQQKSAIDKNKSDAEQVNFSLIDQKKQLEDAKSSLVNQKEYLASQVKVLGVQISSKTNQQTSLSTEQAKIESQVNTIEQQIFASIKTIKNGKRITKGEIIGLQGNTGNSTGEHLHFTLAINGVKVDGCKYMPSSGILSFSGLNCNYGNGSVGLPEYGTVRITQAFGNTSLGYYHDGVDMVGSSGNQIRAAHDGYYVRGKYSCIPGFSIPCNNGGANYVKICENPDCNKGFSSLYIHLRD